MGKSLPEILELDFSKSSFGVQREVAIHNPIIILRFLLQNSGDLLPLVFAEIKDDFILVVVGHSAGEIDYLGIGNRIQRFHTIIDPADYLALQVMYIRALVLGNLRLEHFVGRYGICFRGMGVG